MRTIFVPIMRNFCAIMNPFCSDLVEGWQSAGWSPGIISIMEVMDSSGDRAPLGRLDPAAR